MEQGALYTKLAMPYIFNIRALIHALISYLTLSFFIKVILHLINKILSFCV
jgi:hypothetical protein